HERRRQRPPGDREVLHRPLGLRPPQRRRGHLHLAQAVLLDANVRHGPSFLEARLTLDVNLAHVRARAKMRAAAAVRILFGQRSVIWTTWRIGRSGRSEFETEQYFSTESCSACSTAARCRPRPVKRCTNSIDVNRRGCSADRSPDIWISYAVITCRFL